MTRSRSWSASFTSLLTSKPSTEETKKGTNRLRRDTFTPISVAHASSPSRDSPQVPQGKTSRTGSRPMSILQPYQPPLLEVERDTLPELQRIFTYLNSHSKKLYTEGYFLKLSDLNPDGKPSHDRSWQECFAQLVGTVLSLWDAAELDAAIPGQEVVPTFLNLTDASIKMIDTLPTRSADVPPLTNVLSISTAGRNRYLFHFNSHHSLIQWTAGIRLCMFEHSSLQEAYTGALIAGKGKTLNGINTIIEKTRFKYEDWARVRFGAGTPWRRCWAVVTPPDVKQVKKQKALLKKTQKTGYTTAPVLRGDIRFYEHKKSKKSPIATIADAYSAYAIYPQSKPLIDQSTLVKIEGRITIHSDPPTTSEGFVFVMPEAHPAVSGFEMMLRWLFPTFDTFALYGRPNRLAADVSDIKSLMFAMPNERQYGYLDVPDVVSLIVSEGNTINSESAWRLKLKQATADKIKNGTGKARPRSSLPAGQRFPGIAFDDDSTGSASAKSSSSLPVPASQIPPQHVPPNTPPLPSTVYHQRSASESTGYTQYRERQRVSPSLYSMAEGQQGNFDAVPVVTRSDSGSSNSSLFQGRPIDPAARRLQQQIEYPELSEVPPTPTMMHPPSSRPQQLPQGQQVQRKVSNNTLNAMGGGTAVSAAAAYLKETGGSPSFYLQGMQDGRTNNDFENGGLMYPPPPPPGPPPHLLPSQNSQITAQSSLPYQSPIEPPPGFQMQNSQVLLAGPPPTGDTKVYDEGYIRPPQAEYAPPLQSNASSSDNQRLRFSWQETPAQTPVQPIKVGPYTVMEGLEPLPSPPIPAKIPLKSPNTPQVPNLQTNISRKPLPAKEEEGGGEGGADTPKSADSIGSLAGHLMNPDVLDRIGRSRDDEEEEDTLDRRRASRLQQMLSDNANISGSEYSDSDDDEPDYTSVHSTEEPPKRDTNKPRAGVMKVVGTKIDSDVIVGDTHYQHTAPMTKEPADIPKIDFGATINHGRSLSAESRVSRGNAQFIDQDTGLVSQHGTSTGMDARRGPQGLAADWNEHNHASSKSSAGSERRDSWNRPSPELGNERAGSHGSDSGESKRRSMIWQPGMVQVGSNFGNGKSPEKSAEQYVTERAAAAQQQSRSRYLHQRRSSQAGTPSPTIRNTSAEHLPPRPNSRGGNAAFIPNGLVSSAGDLSSHLSAREQEYVAKQTGSTLLHVDGKKKQPPHQAGLLAAIETREMEKRIVGNSATAQQAIVQRQQLQLQLQLQLQQQQQLQQRQDTLRRKTPSPRLSGYGAYESTSYLPQQGGYVAYGQQQQQAQQQQHYNQQGHGYGQQQYGNPQGQQGYSRQ